MRALKLEARIEADRTLRLQLPADVHVGPAEVIVLLADATENQRPLEEILGDLAEHRHRRQSQSELNHRLEVERASWV